MAQDSLQHFEYTRTDVSMSIIVRVATLEGDPLVEGDEIGVFTENGLCGGASSVGEGGWPEQGVGIAAWADEDGGEVDGFIADELITFRVWESEADAEWEAEITEIVAGPDPLEYRGDFALVHIAAIRGPEHPSIWVSELAHEFGIIRVGQQAEWNFTVANRGREPLVVSAMEMEGDHFSVNFEGEFTLEFQEESEFTVTFAPEEQGDFQATLSITSNDEENQVVQIDLTGSAEPALPPTITLSDDQHNFGRVIVENENHRSWTLTIGNAGDEMLTVQEIAIDNEVFESDFGESFDLGSGETQDVMVTFTPAAAEVYDAEMTITSTDPNNQQVTARLFGQGVEIGEPGSIALERAEYFFGNVVVEDIATWRMEILNVGEGDLWVYDILSENEVFSTDFGIDSVRIRPDDRWYVEVSFSPANVLIYDDSLTVLSNDPENDEFRCLLGGVGGEDDDRHFRYQRMEVNHSLLVLETVLGDDVLVEGDEIGVFTLWGLCAGAGVTMEDGRTGVAAWGDDEGTEIIDGFVEEEPMTFMVWDVDAEIEAFAVAEFGQGPEVYTAGGFTVLNLTARPGPPVPNIRISDDQHFYGQVSIEDGSEDWILVISNVGQGLLEIESIESDLDEFRTDFGDEPVQLEFNEELEVTVTFRPTEVREYVGRLTINSDDLDDDILYVDLFGQGVMEVREPAMELSAENYFFGVQHLDSECPFVLEISNTGGADLLLESVTLEGDDVFSSDFPDRRRVIGPGASYDLTIIFIPNEEREFNADFTILSNDPIDEEYVFSVRGYGLVSEDHFLHLNTGLSHRIVVSRAIITTLQEDETPLVPEDEIAAFTPGGLCAGHVVIEEVGAQVQFEVYGNDPNNPFRDGFAAGEDFSFMFWDWTTRDELECRIEFGEGPQQFSVRGLTELELWADAMHDEARILADPRILNLGPVSLGEANDDVLAIRNDGGIDLTVTGVESQDVVFTHDFGEPILLHPGESFDLSITFRPRAARAYEGTMLVMSDDPDDPEYEIYPVGMGSEYEGHFAHYISGTNHSILVQSITVGGVDPAPFDEIGLITEAGFCAGGTVIMEPGQQGPAAFGDDDDTEMLVEGFVNDEQISFRFWDSGQEQEFEPEVEIIQGDLEWTINTITLVNLRIPDLFGIIPVGPFEEVEGAEIAFDLELANGEGNFDFVWVNQEEYEGLADAEFAFDNNVGHFTWQTDNDVVVHPDAEAEFNLVFTADNGDGMLDRTVVNITITDENRAPIMIEEVRAAAFDGEDYEHEVHLEEDADWTDVVNLDEMFVDEDNDEMLYYYDVTIDEVDQRITNQNIYQVRPEPNFAGRVDAYLEADDCDDVMQAHRITIGINRDQNTRTLRRVDGGVSPRRDETVRYDFVIVVAEMNDPPEITEPTDEDVYAVAVNEGVELVIPFEAVDEETAAEDLVWAIDPDALPDGWVFDADAAIFTWTPTFDDASPQDQPYDPIFTVTDVDEDNPQTDQVTVEITVRNVNREPGVRAEIPDYTDENAIMEDAGRTDLAVLDTVFVDPDDDPDDPSLEFAIVGDPPVELNIDIDEQNILFIEPVENYNLPLGVEITVQATDPVDGSSIQDAFMLVIAPVNDPPGAFQMLTPEDELRIAYIPDSLATVDFTWRLAIQNVWESDTVRYMVVFRIEGEEDTSATPLLDDIEYLGIPIQAIADSLGYERWNAAWIQWWVWAVDTTFYVLAENATFRFEIPALGVDEDNLAIPETHYMLPTFPNPFNAVTNIRFGLPQPETVEVAVWDMHGRKVEMLASGHFAAGRYEAVWDAEGHTSGIYLIRIQAGKFTAMQKAILIR